jgi:hypothetical protein
VVVWWWRWLWIRASGGGKSARNPEVLRAVARGNLQRIAKREIYLRCIPTDRSTDANKNNASGELAGNACGKTGIYVFLDSSSC